MVKKVRARKPNLTGKAHSMTKKNYELIAGVLRPIAETVVSREPGRDCYTAIVIAYKFAKILETENKSFDRARFLKACGVAQ